MPVTRRSKVVGAPPAIVWQTVADPNRLPAWWPRAERVEGVNGNGFTLVLRVQLLKPQQLDLCFAGCFFEGGGLRRGRALLLEPAQINV